VYKNETSSQISIARRSTA